MLLYKCPLTKYSGEEFKGHQLVVLEKLDEGEHEARQVARLPKHRGPVSQRRQCSEGRGGERNAATEQMDCSSTLIL